MAAQRPFEVGKAIILLTGPDDPISSGHTTGYLEFYDERYRPTFPLSSQAIYEHLQAIWNESKRPALVPRWTHRRLDRGPG